MDNRILFVHIPKTAGTSFRLAAEKYFTKENTLYDYSPSSVETSEVILEYFYKQKDLYKLKQETQKKDKCFLSGHFHIAKYMYLFETLNIITFVRNPVDQVLSHYEHHCRHLGYTKDLRDFIQEDRFKNVQSRLLSAKPLELIGFIGLTERYNESIEMINDYYGFNLEILKKNINPNKKVFDIDESIVEQIKKENSQDVELYEKAKALFEDRWHKYLSKEVYIHTYIQEENDDLIKGVAFTKNMQSPLKIKIPFQNTEVEVIVKDYRPGMLAHNFPRDGFVGFEYKKGIEK